MSENRKKKRQKRVKRIIWLLVLIMLLAGLFYLLVWPQLTAAATTTYDSYTAVRGTISNSLSFSGNISVKNYETLTSGSEATVRKVYVAEEQQVAKDERLVRLSNGETIKASFDGQVNQISVEEGDTVASGADLIQIVDFSNMKVSLRVDEYSISQVYVGQECSVNVTALDLTFDSKITHINRISASNGTTAYYTVTAEVSVTSDVLPGMQATVTIPQDEAADAVILNKDALSFDRQNSAYVLTKDENGDMQETTVEIGVDNDNYVEITAGLAENDTVYKVAQSTASSSGGLFSGLASLFGGGQSSTQQSSGMPSDFSGMPSDFSGMPSDFGSMPSGFGGGNRKNGGSMP